MLKVLITGSNGFIGKNLKLFLKERKDIEIICFNKEHDIYFLEETISKVDFIFHLAGVNRSKNITDFQSCNADLTKTLCNIIRKVNYKKSIVYTSSIQANSDTPYGISKKKAEDLLIDLNKELLNPVYIFRLPNIFGKWSKPNYNSVVATFCHNIIREITIKIDDENKLLELIHIDEVIKKFIQLLDAPEKKRKSFKGFEQISKSYKIKVGALAKQFYAFKSMSKSKILEKVGTGLTRALYSTYVSFLPPEKFSYTVSKNVDSRGIFTEILKTNNHGQFSFFTTLPGITRGNHYHHSKTEKFLVIKGKACFKFFNMETNDKYELSVNSDKLEMVETIPGWSHSITNIGDDEMITILWSNEIYNPLNPDTFHYRI